MALRNQTRPDRAITVFAGADIEATERARGYFTGYRPSSPSVALFKDGKLVFMLERSDIEGRDAPSIAQELSRAFDQHCTTTNAANA
jgi:putative YphP/YqiW family bacilliredoxin